MPVCGGKTEPQKIRPIKQKTKSKKRKTQKNGTKKPIKNLLNSKESHLKQLTPENFSSLRWDYELTDPTEENNRIDQYKELRRQRYVDAQQQAIQILVEKMKITISEK